MIPATKHTTETAAALITTPRNVLHTRMDVSAGKMIRLEMSRAPIIRMPSTIVTAVSTAIQRIVQSRLHACRLGEGLVERDRKDLLIEENEKHKHDHREDTADTTSSLLMARILPNISIIHICIHPR